MKWRKSALIVLLKRASLGSNKRWGSFRKPTSARLPNAEVIAFNSRYLSSISNYVNVKVTLSPTATASSTSRFAVKPIFIAGHLTDAIGSWSSVIFPAARSIAVTVPLPLACFGSFGVAISPILSV